MKQAITKNKLFVSSIFLLWVKSYIVYKTVFDLNIENWIQEIILFINPVSSVVFLSAFSLFFIGKARNIAIIMINFIGSFVLYANVVYYRFFTDFITIPVLFQTNNMGDLGESIFSLLSFYDTLLFVDIILLTLFIKVKRVEESKVSKKQIVKVFSAAVLIFIANVGISQLERPQLLTRAFDREMLVKNIGAFNFHIYDAIIQSKAKTQRAFADGDEIVEIENYVRSNHRDPNEEFYGKAKGKNVIVISMESTQNFVINNTVDGNEITPFLNELIKDSFYFPNFYHQTGQGKTSDAEFILENSLYPLPSGSVFFTHSQNEYNAVPEILKKDGYDTAVFHANNKSFWNRDIMYQSFGYDRFYSAKDYDVTPENSVGWGLKDDYFFDQSIPNLKSLSQPFYVKFLTLTNHFPFTLEQKDEIIPEWTSEDGTVNRYFTTVRYMDEALKGFFDRLKAEGLYENSIFILYGDHYGISQNRNQAMAKYLGKDEITPLDTVELQKVPLIVHIPGQDGKVMETVSGQIDVRPTLMRLLGMETKNTINFGTDLFVKNRPELAVFRDGSFITKDVVYTENTCYDKLKETEVDKERCEPLIEQSRKGLDYSDKVIYGDLLRFFDSDKEK
jgi:lipoteichoic acid synthase